jgi:diaminopropionate ammonia-lyase
MRNLDAEVIRVKGNYDNSLKECIEQSNKNNWEIVQDVSWEGYKEVPKLIMAGYTIMVKEIIDEMDKNSITHVFLQAGVGGMAAAMIAGFAKLSENIPQFIIIEPENADCVFQSIKNNTPTTVDIKKETVMGGMSCGDVSSIAWEILKNSANYCLTIPDEAISTAVALLAEKRLSNERIIGGECAVPGVIALIGSFNNKEYLDKLKLNSESNVLLFGCEGLTDDAMYQKLLNDGLQKI